MIIIIKLEKINIRRLYHWINIWMIWSIIISVGFGKCCLIVSINVFRWSTMASFLIGSSTFSVIICWQTKMQREKKSPRENRFSIQSSVIYHYYIAIEISFAIIILSFIYAFVNMMINQWYLLNIDYQFISFSIPKWILLDDRSSAKKETTRRGLV